MNNFFYSLKTVHFIGVGGVSMSKLCAYTKGLGIKCTGSDAKKSDTIKKLESLGVNIVIGENRDFAREADLVVYSSAIKANHPELLAAKKTMERKDYLALVAKNFDKVIAVSGAHGKTTTTAMIAWIFSASGKSFTSHIGGDFVSLEGIGFGSGREYFITEACEYSKSFLKLFPDIGVVLNVDYDHPDCYHSLEDTCKAFEKYMTQSKCVVAYGELDFDFDKIATKNNTKIVLYGNKNAQYQAQNVVCKNGKVQFDLYKNNIFCDNILLYTPNEVNVRCALAAIAVCDMVGIDAFDIKHGLQTFPGLKNRYQCLGLMSNGAKMIVDYAHHPSQIKYATLSAYKNLLDDGDLIVLFEPHTYSRTKALFKDFCEVLKGDWTTILMPTYSAREKPDDGYDSVRLYAQMCKSNDKIIYVDGYEKAKQWLKENAKCTDTILCLGAGLVSDKLIF